VKVKEQFFLRHIRPVAIPVEVAAPWTNASNGVPVYLSVYSKEGRSLIPADKHSTTWVFNLWTGCSLGRKCSWKVSGGGGLKRSGNMCWP